MERTVYLCDELISQIHSHVKLPRNVTNIIAALLMFRIATLTIITVRKTQIFIRDATLSSSQRPLIQAKKIRHRGDYQ